MLRQAVAAYKTLTNHTLLPFAACAGIDRALGGFAAVPSSVVGTRADWATSLLKARATMQARGLHAGVGGLDRRGTCLGNMLTEKVVEGLA